MLWCPGMLLCPCRHCPEGHLALQSSNYCPLVLMRMSSEHAGGRWCMRRKAVHQRANKSQISKKNSWCTM